jgi:hypothetical protein
MASEIELKKHVLDMLRDFMMGEEGKQFTPKSVEVEMEPKGKEGLDEVLSKASHAYRYTRARVKYTEHAHTSRKRIVGD